MRSGRVCEMRQALAALIALLALSGCAAKEATVAETSEAPTVMAETPAIAEAPPAPAAEKEPETAAEQEGSPVAPEQKAEREETPAAPEQETEREEVSTVPEESTVIVEDTSPAEAAPEEQPIIEETVEEDTKLQNISLSIAGQPLTVEWADNASVDALRELLQAGPLSVQLSQYGGFEQVGALGTSLPRNDVQTTTEPGDIVLYSGNQIVMFYGSNSWAYTRLGKIAGMSGEDLTALLGVGGVTATLSLAEDDG